MSNTIEKRKKISAIANEMMEAGYLKDAQRFLEESIMADIKDWRLLYQLGGCFDRQARETLGIKRFALREESASMYMAASNAAPTDFSAANMAAFMLLKTKRFDGALAYALRANDIRPHDREVVKIIAMSYEGLGKKTAALAYYDDLYASQSRHVVFAGARIKALTA